MHEVAARRVVAGRERVPVEVELVVEAAVALALGAAAVVHAGVEVHGEVGVVLDRETFAGQEPSTTRHRMTRPAGTAGPEEPLAA
jgi:transcriptional regulator of nitric oxide reductase